MVAHWEELEQYPPMRNPLFASLAVHVAILGIIAGWTWWQSRARDTFGDPNASPGPGFVTSVDTIPLPTRAGRPNPVANDTDSQVPSKPKPDLKQRIEEEDKDAISLGKRKKLSKKEKKKLVALQRFQKERTYNPNQVYSSTGAAMSTPMYATPGGGGVGFGTGNPFGTRFGAYADLIRRVIGQKWRSQDVDAAVSTGVAIVSFEIQRSGQVTNIRLLQRGSNYSLDTSVLRAVQEAIPLPPLPPEFERNSATVEFQFQLKR